LTLLEATTKYDTSAFNEQECVCQTRLQLIPVA